MSRSALPQNHRRSDGTILNDCNSLTGWAVGGGANTSAVLDPVHCKAGTNGIKLTSSNTYPNMSRTFPAGTFKGTKNIAMWIYIPDVSAIQYLGIRLSSTIGYTAQLGSDFTLARSVRPGWNWLVFQVGAMSNTGGEVLDNCRYMMIRVFPAAGKTAVVTFGGIYKNPDLNKCFVLSFDDGNISDYTIAYPVLQAAGVKGSFFVISSSVGNGYHITLAQLQEMYAAGHDICNHGVQHLDLTTLTDSQIVNEVTGCKDWLIANGMPRGAYHFSYPLSNCNQHIFDLLGGLGIIAANGSVQDITTNIPYDNLDIKELISISNTTTTVQIKAAIDKVDARGGCGFIQCHKFDAIASQTDTYTAATSMLQYCLNYIKAKNIPVLTHTEWVRQIYNPRQSVSR